ncbi:hypothetical protein YN1_2700 [Nanoarchaeota archaeon]
MKSLFGFGKPKNDYNNIREGYIKIIDETEKEYYKKLKEIVNTLEKINKDMKKAKDPNELIEMFKKHKWRINARGWQIRFGFEKIQKAINELERIKSSLNQNDPLIYEIDRNINRLRSRNEQFARLEENIKKLFVILDRGININPNEMVGILENIKNEAIMLERLETSGDLLLRKKDKKLRETTEKLIKTTRNLAYVIHTMLTRNPSLTIEKNIIGKTNKLQKLIKILDDIKNSIKDISKYINNQEILKDLNSIGTEVDIIKRSIDNIYRNYKNIPNLNDQLKSIINITKKISNIIDKELIPKIEEYKGGYDIIDKINNEIKKPLNNIEKEINLIIRVYSKES